MGTGVDPVAVAEEQRRADTLRLAVDVAAALIRQGRLARNEAEALVVETRRHALQLFPGKEHVFDLVLAPRFARLLDEFTIGPSGARVLPFRRP